MINAYIDWLVYHIIYISQYENGLVWQGTNLCLDCEGTQDPQCSRCLAYQGCHR